ncbi:hypothetical protein DERP_012968 [Dermatophagoides pteronyssinus]|uniref:Uncharacterized protein n=1 Tax=Dermatophagoides pteronyssinus TaxID=6956 RepID=A0ABQ8ISF8_DERPT|nr:hypothetical protein DERP_012968 [Dermatophagoides pteronyssinus]
MNRQSDSSLVSNNDTMNDNYVIEKNTAKPQRFNGLPAIRQIFDKQYFLYGNGFVNEIVNIHQQFEIKNKNHQKFVSNSHFRIAFDLIDQIKM